MELISRITIKSRMINSRIKKILHVIFYALIAILGICSCKPLEILNTITPGKGYSVYYDIAYGAHPRQTLDIYVPEKLITPHTTIVYFYGGSWQFGDKNMYRFLGQAFASKGFITVIVNYRLYPEVYFPAFIEDGAKAVHWVHRRIQKYGGDSSHVFLAGHSAGAHIAALLMTDEHYLKAEGGNLSWLKGMIGIAGPYDFLPFTDPKVKTLFSKKSDAKTQPINFVKGGLPSFLLVTGDEDKVVSPKNTYNFAYRLRSFKVPVTEILYPNIGHIGIILSLATGFRYRTSLLEDITHFVESVNNKK
ncbi:MAG: alpha/beta hydrolase [Tatlockia sp.]|nr:alpha/beta hydrolase [Tatlockia sp.]